MKITESAQNDLRLMFQKLDKDVLSIFVDKSNKDNPSLNMEIIRSDECPSFDVIDSINVYIEPEIKELFDDVTIDFINGQYLLKSCGGCLEDSSNCGQCPSSKGCCNSSKK